MKRSGLRPAVVLVADRTLSADYRILFEGIFATMQTTQVPGPVMRHFLAPPVRTDADGRARTAPLGLRRVESALVHHTTLGPADVVCTTPERLPDLLGPWVKVVGFSSSDPLGHGMSNTTTSAFWDGDLYTARWSRETLGRLAEAKRKHRFKVIGGGAGAWQWDRYEDPTARAALDVIFEGAFEKQGPALVTDLIAGREVPSHVVEDGTAADRVCSIHGGSLLGIIELSRGCGRGCRFCSMAHRRMDHLPVELICEDLRTNVAAGIRSVVSGSEDFFRYGARGLRPDFDRLHGLLSEMRKVEGLSFMQMDHGNVTSVAQLSDDQLREIRSLLQWENRCDYLWVNMGVESASGHLVAANCPGKVAPFRPDDWSQLIRDVADKLDRTGFFPVFSLVLGLPGETPEHLKETRRFVEFLASRRAVVFPVFYEPWQKDEILTDCGFRVGSMTQEHLDLFRACYEINFRRVPKLYWDNQRCGGVSLAKRMLVQALGRTEVVTWRRRFARIQRRIDQSARKTAERVKDAG